MSTIRSAAVAGAFYPQEPSVLHTQVEKLLSEAETTDQPVPKAIIAPHAGYIYSGNVAAQAYARLKPAADTIKRVILLGPCHRVAVRGLALSGADYFATPLGNVEVDREAESLLANLPQVNVFEATHELEHSLEVHLPFLQVILHDFRVVPIVVGQARPAGVAQVLERLWGGPETLIVISSDLSHFLDYDTAQKTDQRTCDLITSYSFRQLTGHDACGYTPISGLLALARQKHMKIETLAMQNSGDTAGNRDRVVGYGAWALCETDSEEVASDFEQQTHDLLNRYGTQLLALADRAIRYVLEHHKPWKLDNENIPPDLNKHGACFVTLKTPDDQLRGCIGSPQAHRSLYMDVADNAIKAAFRDTRFSQVTPKEYENLSISISVLSPQTDMTFDSEDDLLEQLRPGTDGLVIQSGSHRSLFLPSVWEQLPDPKEFLTRLKMKAGLPADYWSDDFRASRFIAVEVKSR